MPWIPNKRAPRPDCKIIHLGVDPLFSAYPMRGFPCDLAITGVLSATLPALTQALALRQGAAADRIEARRRRLAELREAQRARWQATLAKAEHATPMHPAWISHCLERA